MRCQDWNRWKCRTKIILVKPSVHRYITYGSLLFLLLALVQLDYLVLPRVYSWPSLSVSLLLLFAGFLVDALSWQVMLRRHGVPVRLAHGVASAGLSVFAKYIPGKVWVAFGRTAYVCAKTGAAISIVGTVAIKALVLIVSVGLIFGVWALFVAGDGGAPALFTAAGVVAVLVALFHPGLNGLLFRRLSKHDGQWPAHSLAPTFRDATVVVPLYAVVWICWMAGFVFLVGGVSQHSIPAAAGLGFALAVTAGILAVIIPGGLGVREGVLAAFLMALGMPAVEAATISVTSRLWFLAGEGFAFAIGLIADATVRGE